MKRSNRRHANTRWLAALICMIPLAFGAMTQAAGLLIADGGFGGVLEIKEHNVNVTINNGIAVTEVEQVFVNTESRQVEALYTFPVPKGASVANFSMWINGKEMIGEVVEKERAREIYDSYKRVRRDPGLLEQVDYKTFEMRIFPIAAGAEQRVRIAYYQELDYDHNWATYVYPLATVTRRNIDQRTTGRMSLNLRVLSEVPIAGMESPSHGDDFVMVDHSPKFHQASLELDGGDLGRDFVVAYQTTRPRTGLDLITSKPDAEDGYFMLTMTAGEELAAFDEPMDYVFILDISGSMKQDGKLRASTGSVRAFIDELGEKDRFEVVAFNVQPEILFSELRAADDAAKAEAGRFLGEQQARGGTVLAPAMTTAYKYGNPDRPLNIVILSDGMTEQKERAELLRLIEQRPANARLFAIGVGNEVNRPLLKQMAEEAEGLAAFVSQGDDFERQAKAFRRKLTRPVATGLNFKFDGGDVYDLEPQRAPNLYHGAPVRVFGRYRRGGELNVTVAGDINGKAFEQTVAMLLPKTNKEATRGVGNPEIERMWAWHRVQRLLGEADRNGSRSGVIPEIVALGEGYSIVTEYTSFIVLENDEEYERWNLKRRNAVRIERDRAARAALEQELQRLRDKAAANLGPAQFTSAPAGDDPAKADAKKTATRSQPATPAPNRDLDLGDVVRDSGGGGGGAIDPVTGLVITGLGGMLLMSRKRRNQGSGNKGDEPSN